MKSLFRRSSAAPSAQTRISTNSTPASLQDDSSKMSVTELTSTSNNEPKYTPSFAEQPGLMLANEDATLPKPSNDKEVALEDSRTASTNDTNLDSHKGPPAYVEGTSNDTPHARQNVKPDLLSQEVLAPDGMEKEIAVPQRTTSTYSLLKSSSQQQSRTYREYSFYYTNTMAHLIICDPDSRALFFAESSAFTRGRSDIFLYDIANAPDDVSHRGSNLSYKEAASAPIVASADFVQANNIKIGLGDPVQPESAKWLMMRNIQNDVKHNIEKFETLTTDLDGVPTGTLLQWNRGSDDEESKGGRKSSDKPNSRDTFRMSYGDNVIASFRNASVTSIKKRGHLRIFETALTDEMMLLVFISFASLCEKQRRRKVKKSLLMGM